MPIRKLRKNKQLERKESTTSYIPLPKLLVEDIKSLQLSSTQKSHCYKFIGILLRDSYKEFRNITSATPKPQTYLIKAFDDKYYKWLNVLIENNIVVRSDIYSHANHKCYDYSISSSYFLSNPQGILCKENEREPLLIVGYKDIVKKITLNDRINKKRFKEDILSLKIDYDRLQNIIKDRVNNISITEFETNEKIKVPVVKIFVPKGKSFFIKTIKAITNAKKKNMSLIKNNGKYIIENEKEFMRRKKEAIDFYYTDSIENLRMNNFKAKRNGTNNRLNTNLTNMPSLLVNDICYQNNLIQIDLKNSQFAILSHILQDELATDDFKRFKALSISGELYDYVAKKLDLSVRKLGKEAMFEILFSSRKNNTTGKATIKKIFPSVVSWIDNFKKLHDDDFFSVMLQLKESSIFIDNIFKEIKANKLFCLTKHDSFIVKENDAPQILKIVKDYFDKIKFEYKLSIEKIDNNGNKINLAEFEIQNEIKEEGEESLVEIEMSSEISYADFYFVPKSNKYSNVQFRLWNGTLVFIPKVFLNKWNASLHMKGLMNGLGRNNDNQSQFDYDLFKRLT